VSQFTQASENSLFSIASVAFLQDASQRKTNKWSLNRDRCCAESCEPESPPGRARAEGEGEMTSYDPDPNLPDHVSIGQVRLPPTIKRSLVAAGLKTVGDVRKTSDAMLLSIQNLGRAPSHACEKNWVAGDTVEGKSLICRFLHSGKMSYARNL
jgi:hypothetical protein